MFSFRLKNKDDFYQFFQNLCHVKKKLCVSTIHLYKLKTVYVSGLIARYQ